MTKGLVMVKALIAQGNLKETCNGFKASYKVALSVSKEKSDPTYEFMKAFSRLIPVGYWFEEADDEFIAKAKDAVEKYHQKHDSKDNANA